MPEMIDREDLAEVKISPSETGGMKVRVRCPLCLGAISLYLSTSDVEMGQEGTVECQSGRDWPQLFELHARSSPSETDHEDGVDLWGMVYDQAD